MNPDPNRDAERLLAEAAELGRAASGLGAATPAEATGTDSSGQVEIRLIPGGHPDQIRVNAGWAGQLGPAELGAAVVDAAEDADRTAVRRPSDRDWPAAAEVGDPLAGGQVRDVEELAEAVIRALQDAAATSAKVIAGFEQPRTGDGTDDGGHVRVTLSGGRLTGCWIDEFWAAGQDGHTLGAALTQAARRAAAALPASEPTAGAGNALLADVLTTQRYQYRQEER